MPIVYLGLGSNLGDRATNIDAALKRLSASGVTIQRVSTLIETEPVGGPPQGRFLNGAAQAETGLAPEALLQLIKSIERDLGRDPDGARNTPRPVDIDILLYDDLNISTPQLTIPHPRMTEREFVLGPLREIAPELKHRIKGLKDQRIKGM